MKHDERASNPAFRGSAETLFVVPTRHLDALRDVLRRGGDPEGAAVELGTTAAAEGIGWSELLRDVEDVSRSVSGSLPPYEMVRAMSIAWTETALQDAYAMSCEDPLTGLTTPEHLRTRLDDVYRLAERNGVSASDQWAFVVVELTSTGGPEIGLLRSLSMIAVAELLRACFDGDETIARLGQRRAVALVHRSDATRGYAMLRDLLAQSSDVPSTRVWVEGVPASSHAASRLLNELGRGSSADGLG